MGKHNSYVTINNNLNANIITFDFPQVSSSLVLYDTFMVIFINTFNLVVINVLKIYRSHPIKIIDDNDR